MLTPSLATSQIWVAISCALSVDIRIAYASISIGKFNPVTIAQWSSWPLSNKFAWLKGVPLHKSTKKRTSSWFSKVEIASSIFALKSSGPSLGCKVTAFTSFCSPKIIEPDCKIPLANSPWLARIIPTIFFLPLFN